VHLARRAEESPRRGWADSRALEIGPVDVNTRHENPGASFSSECGRRLALTRVARENSASELRQGVRRAGGLGYRRAIATPPPDSHPADPPGFNLGQPPKPFLVTHRAFRKGSALPNSDRTHENRLNAGHIETSRSCYRPCWSS